MKIITVANQKGGVGKTTTALTIAHALALKGYKVLVVDLDSQGNVAEALGMEPYPGTFQMLVEQKPLEEVALSTDRDGLYIVPGDNSTAVAKQMLASQGFAEFVLQRALRGTPGKQAPAEDYDLVFLDLAPSLDILHIASIVASDYMLVPVKLDHLALVGVRLSAHTMDEVREKLLSLGAPFDCKLLGVLPTFYERQTKESQRNLELLQEAFGDLVMPVIPTDTKLREAPAHGKTIWEYAPASRGVLGVRVNSHTIGGYRRAALWVEERVLGGGNGR